MTNQTSIPMTSFWNKKIVAIPLTIIVGILIILGLSALGGESKASTAEAQTPLAEEHYKQWVAERESRECEEQKKVAHANYNDVLNGFKVNKDMNSLKEKIEKDCGWNIVPMTKALSFEQPGVDAENTILTTQLNNNVKTSKNPHPVHHGSPEQQKYIDYAWNTYHDKNLIYLMKAENGLITPDRKHSTSYRCPKKKGIFNDWGFGGISDCYHPDIVKDPRFFSDPYWQIDQVYKLYKGGTKFASRKNWPKMAKHFDWV